MAKFSFISTENPSTFQCKLDKGVFKPCRPPKTYRLRPGRHVFQVVAIDASGNRDVTPAKFVVRVVRRR